MFPSLPSFPARLLLQMRDCCMSPPLLPPETVGSLPPKEWRTGLKGKAGREGEGFSGLNKALWLSTSICIILCISCSVSTQCQHGWSVLISKLHHKDKRNTCRHKVILLPTAHVKLFRRTRQARSCSCYMNVQIIASWFLEAKDLILIEVGSLLFVVNLCTCIVQHLLLIWVHKQPYT